MNQKELFPTGNVLPSTSSVGASPASPLVLPGSKEAKKILVTSGRQCLKLLNEKNPNIRLSKMLVGSSMWHSMMCVLTWKVKVTPRNRLLFQLQASVPRIKDKDAGSSVKTRKTIPTPTASDYIERESTSKETMNPMTGKSVSLDRFVKFWPTEEVQKSGKPNLWSTPTTSDRYSAHMKPNEKGIPHDIAKGNLRGEVKFWPTPNARDWKDSMGTVPPSVGKTRGHSLGQKVASEQLKQLKMWPTPRVSDTEGGLVKKVEVKDGKFSRKNKQGVRWGVKLKDAVNHMEQEKLWPTPTAHNAKEGAYPAEFKRNTPSLVIEAQRRNDSGDQSAEDLPNTTSGEAGTEKVKANLNPDWVEWLMGYPEGYSDTEKTEKQSINEHEGWWFEPDIPRITPRKDLRTKRLKCLGNSIVPQIMVEIGKAILEQEKKDAS